MSDKRKHPATKSRLHPRNLHKRRYDLKKLEAKHPTLSSYIILNKYNDHSIDFSNIEAVKALNTALLKEYYNIEYWDIPKGYLCPPIPGRADYIHYVADILGNNNYGKIPKGPNIKCLDIGVGANCIYPIIGHSVYGWSFIGSEIDSIAIESANKIIRSNTSLSGNIEIRKQANSKDIFYGVIRKEERIDISICNPPFHSSEAAAQASNLRKVKNLSGNKKAESQLNFGGKNNELWYEGGENKFIRQIARQSKKFSQSCFWFTTLVSKQSNLKGIHEYLKQLKATSIESIPMGQGNKTSRIVAWTFLTKEEQQHWKSQKWNIQPA